MSKASIAIALIAMCAATVGAAFWIESGVCRTKSQIPQQLTMPSLEELHERAHTEKLSVQELKEPF
jgi:hypothetical protein